MHGLRPEDYELFETLATELFEEAVEGAGLPADDPRLADNGSHQAACELLTKIGLLVLDADRSVYVPVDPAVTQSNVVAPMAREGADLIAESAKWATVFGEIAQSWRRSSVMAGEAVLALDGSTVHAYIDAVVSDAKSELLTAHPQSTRNMAQFAAVAARDLATIDRGIKMRTLYQHSARRNAATHNYVAAVTARGAEVRTLDEFFNRLIVVDRQVALIPRHDDPRAAVAVKDPSLVAYLVDMFERSWERARPFTDRESPMVQQVAAEQRAMTIRMLIEGHADPTSAKRLGISPRTYAGYIADLKDEYEAQTRFQLGYAMGREGVSGREQ